MCRTCFAAFVQCARMCSSCERADASMHCLDVGLCVKMYDFVHGNVDLLLVVGVCVCLYYPNLAKQTTVVCATVHFMCDLWCLHRLRVNSASTVCCMGGLVIRLNSNFASAYECCCVDLLSLAVLCGPFRML